MGGNDVYTILNKFRTALNEHDNGVANNTGAVPYTKQDELMTSVMDAAKTQFGADFSKFKTPMLYYPEDGDVTLSGEITSLNNAKFQFRYKDSGDGCYVWVEPLHLNDDTLHRLSVIRGVFLNWKKELDGVEDLKPLGLRDDINYNF